MAGAQTACSSSREVVTVRGDHHALLRLVIERLACIQVDTWPQFVVDCDFRSEDRGPVKFIATREVDHQRNVAVRYGCQKKVFPLALERYRHIRPCIE